MTDVSLLARGDHGEATGRARGYLDAFSRRRQLLADTTAKIDLLNELVPSIRTAERVIIFTERKATADEASSLLSWQGIRAGAVHSDISKDDRRTLLSQFAHGSLHVLCAPRVLDEGVDVPDADLGIILASSQSRRQMVQRMGRVLRRKSDGRLARFVIAYVVGTSEDPDEGSDEGSYEAFLKEVADVADDVVNCGLLENSGEVCAYLNDYSWKRPISQPRMASK